MSKISTIDLYILTAQFKNQRHEKYRSHSFLLFLEPNIPLPSIHQSVNLLQRYPQTILFLSSATATILAQASILA